MHLYVEVWNIMVCKQNVQDPNKREQTPDVVRERPWHLSDSWEHSVDRRERHRHSHARTHAGTCTHTCMHTDTWHSRTHTHTQTHTRTRRHTHTHARRHTHAHTPRQTRTHTHARTQTHTHAHAHSHAGTHTTRAEGGTPPRLFFGVTVDCSIKCKSRIVHGVENTTKAKAWPSTADTGYAQQPLTNTWEEQSSTRMESRSLLH